MRLGQTQFVDAGHLTERATGPSRRLREIRSSGRGIPPGPSLCQRRRRPGCRFGDIFSTRDSAPGMGLRCCRALGRVCWSTSRAARSSRSSSRSLQPSTPDRRQVHSHSAPAAANSQRCLEVFPRQKRAGAVVETDGVVNQQPGPLLQAQLLGQGRAMHARRPPNVSSMQCIGEPFRAAAVAAPRRCGRGYTVGSPPAQSPANIASSTAPGEAGRGHRARHRSTRPAQACAIPDGGTQPPTVIDARAPTDDGGATCGCR